GGAASKVAAALAEDEVLFRRCMERAAEIVEGIRQGIKAAALVLLQPGQPLLQRSTLVLLNGTLLQHPAANNPTTQPHAAIHQPQGINRHNPDGDGPGPAAVVDHSAGAALERAGDGGGADTGAGASGGGKGGSEGVAQPPRVRSLLMRPTSISIPKDGRGISGGPHAPRLPAPAPMPVFKPPTILLWLPDHCEPAVARMFRQSDQIRYTAGPTGAAVLVCGAEGEGEIVCR
ncbi:hypothetical protein Vafri_2635, partial [Volvox africanus]